MTTRTLTISNVLYHEDLEIEISPGATLITGENSAGKSSVARVLSSLTTHNTNPRKLSAALSKMYLRKGAVEGYASLSDGPTWIVPNKMEIPDGLEPETGEHMVGIVDFIRSPGSSAADRAAIYEQLFLPDNAEELLRPVWNVSEQQLATVVNIIEKKGGWKAAFKVYDEQKKEAGRKWQGATGVQYTKKRGTEWKPDEWETDLEGLSEDDVLSAVAEAQDALRAAGVRQAIDQDRVDRGIEARDQKVPAQKEVVDGLKAEAEEAQAEMKAFADQGKEQRTVVEAAKNALAYVDDRLSNWHDSEAKEVAEYVHRIVANRMDDTLKAKGRPEDASRKPYAHCPWCEQPLDRHFEKWMRKEPVEEAPSDTLIAELEAERVEVDQKLVTETDVLKEISEQYGQKRAAAEEKTAEYNQALGLLKEYQHQAKDADLEVSESNEAQRSQLENERDRATARRKAWETNRDAQRHHENYVEYEEIAKLLGPTGARAKHMKQNMEKVRAALKSISAKTGWNEITITDTYEVMTGGFPAALTSENENKKCQWALQAALTMLDKNAHWLILDAADSLFNKSWDGLVGLCDALVAKRPDLYLVVCATATTAPEGWAEVVIPDAE